MGSRTSSPRARGGEPPFRPPPSVFVPRTVPSPHARGGEPLQVRRTSPAVRRRLSRPHARVGVNRDCAGSPVYRPGSCEVVPTRVGVNRSALGRVPSAATHLESSPTRVGSGTGSAGSIDGRRGVDVRRPHARGGEPSVALEGEGWLRCRPHARGGEPYPEPIFAPTWASGSSSSPRAGGGEPLLGLADGRREHGRRPHARGVNRLAAEGAHPGLPSSPRAWGVNRWRHAPTEGPRTLPWGRPHAREVSEPTSRSPRPWRRDSGRPHARGE